MMHLCHGVPFGVVVAGSHNGSNLARISSFPKRRRLEFTSPHCDETCWGMGISKANVRISDRSRPRFPRTRSCPNSSDGLLPDPAFGPRPPLGPARVVRTLARDRHVAHVALA